jgi:hypothetical protein
MNDPRQEREIARAALDVNAFQRGFLRGLGAPALLFSDYKAPVVHTPTKITVRQLEIAGDYDDAEALASDWRRVGGDLRAALRQYGTLPDEAPRAALDQLGTPLGKEAHGAEA